MTTTKTHCRDCAHADEWKRTPTGRIRNETTRCLYVVTLPLLPLAVEMREWRIKVAPDDGAGCLTFQPLPKKP